MANGIGVFSQTEAYPDKLQSNEQDVFAASGFVSSHWSSLQGGTEESELYGGGGVNFGEDLSLKCSIC